MNSDNQKTYQLNGVTIVKGNHSIPVDEASMIATDNKFNAEELRKLAWQRKKI